MGRRTTPLLPHYGAQLNCSKCPGVVGYALPVLFFTSFEYTRASSRNPEVPLVRTSFNVGPAPKA